MTWYTQIKTIFFRYSLQVKTNYARGESFTSQGKLTTLNIRKNLYYHPD